MPRLVLICFATCLTLTFNACKRPEQSVSVKEPSVKEMEAPREEEPEPVAKMPAETVKPDMPDVPKAPEIPGFPFERILKDSQGRKIHAEILGKVDGKIALRRLSDKKRFVLPLEKLGDKDRGFFATVPDGKYMPTEEDADEPEKTSSVRRRAEWLEGFEEAKSLATEEKLPMYVLFTGSKWCPPCKKLEKTILKTDEFKDFANEKLVLVKFDFPKGGGIHGKRERTARAKEFGVESFPTFFITDANGRILGGGKGFGGEPVEDYLKKLETFISKGKSDPRIPSD